MIIKRVWAMPNKWTFKIKPIKRLIDKYVGDGKGWLDPFAGMYSPAEYTNDLNPKMKVKYNLEALEFLNKLKVVKSPGCLFDPPYSLRQIMECYEGIGKDVDKKWATTNFYTDVKNELAEKIIPGGYAICCGWNSIGLGKKRGFKLIEILLVCHGRLHNDTICVVERKMNKQLNIKYKP